METSDLEARINEIEKRLAEVQFGSIEERKELVEELIGLRKVFNETIKVETERLALYHQYETDDARKAEVEARNKIEKLRTLLDMIGKLIGYIVMIVGPILGIGMAYNFENLGDKLPSRMATSISNMFRFKF